MADVQVEHGHVRIANRLFEAILDADFPGAQARILIALVRLTYGWRHRTVTLTVPELAEYCRMKPVGGFRRALRDLVEQGVVLQLEHDRGRTATTYAIQKDFAAWGRYSVAEGRITALWRTRPRFDDDRLDEERQASAGQTLQGDDPTRSYRTTSQGHTQLPHKVTPTPPNPNGDANVASRKDSERQGKTDIVGWAAASAAEGPDEGQDEGQEAQALLADTIPETAEYALQLTVTANNAITEKWGERPTVLHHASAHSLADELRDRGVPVDIARASIIAQLARRRANDGPPRSVHWFRSGIEQAWAQEQQRRLDATTSLSAPVALAASAGAPSGTGGSGSPFLTPEMRRWAAEQDARAGAEHP